MTDKELLELAAKAAGISNLQWESDGTIQNRMNRPTIPYECHGMMSATDWNPLTDDGDALRLAVKLGIDFRFHRHEGAIVTNYPIGRGMSESIVVLRGNDPYEATRRAIVRAAAEIGKSL